MVSLRTTTINSTLTKSQENVEKNDYGNWDSRHSSHNQ